MLFCSEALLLRPIFKPSNGANEDLCVPHRLDFLFLPLRKQLVDNKMRTLQRPLKSLVLRYIFKKWRRSGKLVSREFKSVRNRRLNNDTRVFSSSSCYNYQRRRHHITTTATPITANIITTISKPLSVSHHHNHLTHRRHHHIIVTLSLSRHHAHCS